MAPHGERIVKFLAVLGATWFDFWVTSVTCIPIWGREVDVLLFGVCDTSVVSSFNYIANINWKFGIPITYSDRLKYIIFIKITTMHGTTKSWWLNLSNCSEFDSKHRSCLNTFYVVWNVFKFKNQKIGFFLQ